MWAMTMLFQYIRWIFGAYFTFIRGLFESHDPTSLAKNKRKYTKKHLGGGTSTIERVPASYLWGHNLGCFVHRFIPNWLAAKLLSVVLIHLVAFALGIIIAR